MIKPGDIRDLIKRWAQLEQKIAEFLSEESAAN